MIRSVVAVFLVTSAALSQPIVDVSRSPNAKLHGVPVRAVTLTEGFWAERRRVNADRSLPTLLEQLEQHGIIDNFRRLSGRKQADRKGPLYTDSDVYKWMEAAAFVLQSEDRPELRTTLDRLVDDVLAAQQPDGYLNTYFTDPKQRHTNMAGGHELYCLGHMLQAAIAYYRATGQRKLLDGGIRYANYVLANFGPDKKPIFEGHPEIEMALVELYRTTGEKKYLDFAGYLLRSDSRLKLSPREIVYLFTGKPFTSRTELEGHAVRAMYASCGATDYYLETGDAKIRSTLDRLWSDLAARKVYITGGVGSRESGESFGEAYELPNQLAYTESCAAIGNMMWNWRMLAATADVQYTDMLERALYNGVNSGMSTDGTLYCYRNPLELTGNPNDRIRNPWYSTTCCPPNLERIFASLPGYFYSTSGDGVYVHLFHTGRLDWRLEDGTPLKIAQTTRYPWNDTVDIAVDPGAPKEFTVFVRIPAWSARSQIAINGEPAAAARPGEYAALLRTWKAGDKIRLTLDMRPRVTFANPNVRDNIGKAAVERGPLVYAIESVDQQGLPSLFDARLVLANDFVPEYRADLLGGTVVLQHTGAAYVSGTDALPLYTSRSRLPRMQPADLTLIPYYLFANRQPAAMSVWIPYVER